MSREEYSGLELDSKVEMIRAIPLGLMHVEELLDEERRWRVSDTRERRRR